VIDLDFERIDLLFASEHLRCGVAAEIGQRIDGLRDLRFDEAAHLEHAGRDAAQFGIELGREMLVAHRELLVRRFNRNAR
jgi:hypothetical protein